MIHDIMYFSNTDIKLTRAEGLPDLEFVCKPKRRSSFGGFGGRSGESQRARYGNAAPKRRSRNERWAR